MALLTNGDRATIHADLMRDPSTGETGALKADWRTLVDSLDQFLSDNVTAINNAIPVGIRNNFTPAQKALAVMYVIRKRFLSNVVT